jgi:hypothetical protein
MTKRETAAELVALYGRYDKTSPDKCYSVRLGSRAFFSACTYDLANQIDAAYLKREMEVFL